MPIGWLARQFFECMGKRNITFLMRKRLQQFTMWPCVFDCQPHDEANQYAGRAGDKESYPPIEILDNPTAAGRGNERADGNGRSVNA